MQVHGQEMLDEDNLGGSVSNALYFTQGTDILGTSVFCFLLAGNNCLESVMYLSIGLPLAEGRAFTFPKAAPENATDSKLSMTEAESLFRIGTTPPRPVSGF